MKSWVDDGQLVTDVLHVKRKLRQQISRRVVDGACLLWRSELTLASGDVVDATGYFERVVPKEPKSKGGKSKKGKAK